MKLKILPVIGVSLLLGIVFTYLFFDAAPGVSVVIYTVIVLAGLVGLALRFGSELDITTVPLMGLAVFCAAMVAVRASGMMAFINCVAVLYILALIAYINIRPHLPLGQLGFGDYIRGVLLSPFRFLSESARSLQLLPVALTSSTHASTRRSVIRGIAVAAPLLVLFAILFASADPVFRKYTAVFDGIHIDGSLIGRAIEIAFVACLFIGAFSLIFIRGRQRSSSAGSASDTTPAALPRGIGAVETAIVLGSIEILFLLFILIQLNYFFGGQSLVMSTGYTFAEYARKGYFELIAVGILSVGILTLFARPGRHYRGRQHQRFALLCGVLIAEVLVIMLSALRRLTLYTDTYGLTLLRLLSLLAIYGLALVLIILCVNITRRQSESALAYGIFIVVMGYLVLLNVLNPEALVANQNINRFKTTGKIDTVYLSSLSEDATPALSRLLYTPNAPVRARTARILYLQRQQMDDQHRSWKSATISRSRAVQILQDNRSQLDAQQAADRLRPFGL